MNSRGGLGGLAHLLITLAILIAMLALCGALTLVLSGCGTVSPKKLVERGASYDEFGARTSGWLGFVTNEAGVFMVAAPRQRQRWLELVAAHGGRPSPAATTNEDFTVTYTNGCWLVRPATVVRFNTMNRWRHEELKR